MRKQVCAPAASARLLHTTRESACNPMQRTTTTMSALVDSFFRQTCFVASNAHVEERESILFICQKLKSPLALLLLVLCSRRFLRFFFKLPFYCNARRLLTSSRRYSAKSGEFSTKFNVAAGCARVTKTIVARRLGYLMNTLDFRQT